MPLQDEFAEIIRLQEPLAPFTYLKLGGPAQMFAQPRSVAELARLVIRASEEKIPLHVLGGGCNLLVRDEGVRGVVVRLSEPAFTSMEVQGNRVRAGAGAPLSGLISEAARHSLAGVEPLVGIPGSVGGGLRGNAGSRSGSLGQVLEQVELLDAHGQVQTLSRHELDLDPHSNSFEDVIILAAHFKLEPDNPDSILKRLRKFWIHKKARQPLSFQPAGRLFRDPRGQAADQLIEQAGLQGTHVGGAELSERNANYLVVQPGASARDVLRLIDLVRSKVAERLNQTLELALVVW
jgi:UDP-N-acetylmuramate dehydrogenase